MEARTKEGQEPWKGTSLQITLNYTRKQEPRKGKNYEREPTSLHITSKKRKGARTRDAGPSQRINGETTSLHIISKSAVEREGMRNIYVPVTASSLLLLLRENVVRETMGERVGSIPVSTLIGNIPKF